MKVTQNDANYIANILTSEVDLLMFNLKSKPILVDMLLIFSFGHSELL
jgi:hypothetical protein